MSEDWESFFTEPFDLPCDEVTSKKSIKNKENCPFCCFDCLGEVDCNAIALQEDGYFNSYGQMCFQSFDFDVSDENKYDTISLFKRTWIKGPAIFSQLDVLFKMNSKEIMLLEYGASNKSLFGKYVSWNSNCHEKFKASRFLSLEFFFFLEASLKLLCSDLNYVWMIKEIYPSIIKNLKLLRRQLGKLIDLPDHIYGNASNSSGNKSLQASYHLMHLHLDLRWHHLVLHYVLSSTSRILGEFNDLFLTEEIDTNFVMNEIQLLILELLELSLKRFEKAESFGLKNKSPFSCSCIQELWMLIIRMSNNLCSSSNGKAFWDLLNVHLEMKALQNSNNSSIVKYFHTNPFKFSIFTMWVLSNLAHVHNYVIKDRQDNYLLLESNLKFLFNKEISESNLRIIMLFVEKLCLEFWEPKPETLLILWEHFNKKINGNFYIPGAPPSTLAVVSKTPKGLINQLKSFLHDSTKVTDSFQHFLRIIGRHLKKSQAIPRHWNLLKGRLYSKLTLTKLESLSGVGEYHFVSLYLMLALSQDLNQISLKMVELINSFLSRNKYLSEQLVKGQLALVLLLLENEKDSSTALQPVSGYIGSLSTAENIDIFRLYVETFQEIISLNAPLHLGQHLLINQWISEYLSTLSASDVSRLLDIIVSLLQRLKLYCEFDTLEQNIILIIENLWDQFKSYLENISNQQETPYQVSGIAASLANISLQIRNKERFIEIVNMFAFRDIADISALRQFISIISQNEGINNIIPNFNKIVLKTWVKCCFLCTDVENVEMKELTKSIIKLPELTCFISEENAISLVYSPDPFLDFISCLHSEYANADIWKKQTLRERVSLYFEGLEKSIRPILTQPRDGEKIRSLYKTVGNMIRLISPLIYSKSKPNTLLQQLIDLLLLPMSMRNPDTKVQPLILTAVKLTLHLFLEGLVYLDPESDQYISRVLKELVLVYLPHCMNNHYQNALICVNFKLITSFADFDNSLRNAILNVISNNFLKKKARNPHPHASSALKFIKEVINTHKANKEILVCLINTILGILCDVLMYSEDKSSVNILAKDVLHLILNHELLRSSNTAMDGVLKVLSSLCEENLAWYSRQLFDLLISMISVAPDIIRRFTPNLLEQVKHVEAKRGVAYDRTLRLGIEKIEANLRAIKEAV